MKNFFVGPISAKLGTDRYVVTVAGIHCLYEKAFTQLMFVEESLKTVVLM